MDVKRWNDPKEERREFDKVLDMLLDVEKEAQNPETERLTLHFPKMMIPRKHKE